MVSSSAEHMLRRKAGGSLSWGNPWTYRKTRWAAADLASGADTEGALPGAAVGDLNGPSGVQETRAW